MDRTILIIYTGGTIGSVQTAPADWHRWIFRKSTGTCLNWSKTT